MHSTTTQSRTYGLHLDPAFVLGGMLAFYFLLGRWTFHRLQSDVDAESLFSQPRVWVIVLIFILSCFMFSELRRRGWSEVCTIDFALGVFLVYLLSSAMWAPSSEHLGDKVAEIVMLLIVSLSISLARSPYTNSQMHMGFWWGIVVIGGSMGFFTLAMITDGRAFVPTGGPNVFGRNMGLVGVGALILLPFTRSWMRLYLLMIVGLAPIWVVMTGSRGALLSIGVAGLVLFFLSRVNWNTKLITIVTIVACLAIAFLGTAVGRNAIAVFQYRILHQTVEQRHTSSRDELFTEAFEVGLEEPIVGVGLSGFRAGSWNYPHNVFLEAFSEGGIIGFVLLMIPFFLWWISVRGYSLQTPAAVIAATALLTTSASFSGNFYDSRGIFLYLAISIAPLGNPSLKRGDRAVDGRVNISQPTATGLLAPGSLT